MIINNIIFIFIFIFIFFFIRTEPECLYTHVYTGENLSEEETEMSKSSLEAAKILEKDPDFPEKEIRKLKRSRTLEIRLHESSVPKKLLLLLRNADIVFPRIFWKVKAEAGKNRWE